VSESLGEDRMTGDDEYASDSHTKPFLAPLGPSRFYAMIRVTGDFVVTRWDD
jgi:hypothetical protein